MSYNEMPLMEFPPCTNQRPNICGIQINRDCNGVDSSKSVDLGPTGPCLWVKTFLVQLSKWTAMQKNNKYTDERKHTMYIVHELYKINSRI
jgi:hypothetical protein